MARGCHQGIDLSYRIDGSPQPLHGFRAPSPKCLNGEGHQTASGQRTGRIASVLPIYGSSSRGAVYISRPMEPGAAFWSSLPNLISLLAPAGETNWL